MSRQRHYYGLNHLHYITASTYRRARLFNSERFRRHFVKTLGELRQALGFKVLGYVLMPEHFHMLIWPSDQANPSQIIQSLKERTAIFILKNLAQNRQRPWCRRMLERVALPPSVRRHGPYRVWQRRFYDLNVWSEKKRLEKLHYMHGNPVKRGLVTSPDQWPWSSFRFYYLGDPSVLPMDHLP
ncbi:MAG: transposase [Acidobacteriia bacterium]|nr:transposase [Terriglobia bacterium]